MRIRHTQFLHRAIAGTCTSPRPQQQALSPIQQPRFSQWLHCMAKPGLKDVTSFRGCSFRIHVRTSFQVLAMALMGLFSGDCDTVQELNCTPICYTAYTVDTGKFAPICYTVYTKLLLLPRIPTHPGWSKQDKSILIFHSTCEYRPCRHLPSRWTLRRSH